MARFVNKQKQEIGLSPDELLFRGKRKIENVLLRIIDFDAEHLEESALQQVREAAQFKEKESVTWLNVDGLHSSEIMEQIADIFDLEKIILAEVMDTQKRSTVQEYDNCIFVSIKMLQQKEDAGYFWVENLSLIIMDHVLISFQERKGDVFEPVRERIRKQKKRIRSGGTDYLAFALLDIVVDNYIYVIGCLGEKIEALEDSLSKEPSKTIIEDINAYKRELNFLRKTVKPAKEMILYLSKMDSELIYDSTYLHFKELLDNINQATDSSESYREILTDQLNIYHTTISSKLNDVMKFLTIFSVIFIPMTFIAGIYGTNFDFVPELHYKYSYFIMWGVMLVVAVGMLIYFRVQKWF
jgi:magnesium transporter